MRRHCDHALRMGDYVDSRVMQGWRTLPEGQFFERKSAWDRSDASVQRRRATDIARDVAETLSAMANADGGELVIGIEDNGNVTGVDQPDDKLAVIMDAARSRCVPPVAYESREVMDGGLLLLHFSVDWSPEVHDLTDGRTLLRRRDQNMPFSQADVAALKATKAQGLVERQYPPGATLADIDEDLVESLRERLRPGRPLRRSSPRTVSLSGAASVSFPISRACCCSGAIPRAGIRAATSTSSASKAPRGRRDRD